jgi:hypothetical protein
MGSYRQTLLHDFATLMTFLTGETWIHANDLMTSSLSLVFKNIKECTPRRIENALGQMVIFYHIENLQIFHGNMMILFGIAFGNLEMMITALAVDLQMGFGNITGRFPSSMTALLPSAQLALLTSQGFLRCAIKSRVWGGVPLAIGKKYLQSYINANIRMFTATWCMQSLWFGFTNNQGIPMSISPKRKMYRFGRALDGTMQFDLKDMPKLLGDNEVFLVFMQIAVLAVLSELNGVPAIGLLEAREADPRDVMFPGSKEAFEGLGEAVRKHLNAGGGNMFTLPFE